MLADWAGALGVEVVSGGGGFGRGLVPLETPRLRKAASSMRALGLSSVALFAAGESDDRGGLDC